MHLSSTASGRSILSAALFVCALTLFVLAGPLQAAGPVVSAGLSPATLPVTGGVITVTATVTSAQSLTSVKAFIYKDGSYTNFSVTLSNGGSGNVYTGTFGSAASNTTSADYVYTCTVTATDSASQSNTALTGTSKQAHDNVPPVITSPTLTPATLPVTGGVITVTATATDPGSRPLTSVKAFIYRDGSYTNFSVTLSNNGSGSAYTGAFSSAASNTTSADYIYSVVITATNDLGLSSSSTLGHTAQAHDNVPPVISAASISPTALPVTGGAITFRATVTDPASRPVTLVKAFLYRDGVYLNASVVLSNGGSGTVYTGAIGSGGNASSAAYTYTGTITATDDLNLSSSANVSGNAVQGDSGPTPSLIPALATSDPASPVLSPSFLLAGGPDFSLTVRGSNFVSGASVLWNGVALTPSALTATQIAVVVPASLTAQAGSYAVAVANPSPGGTSNSVILNVKPANSATTHILWNNTNGQLSLWNYSTATGAFTERSYGPFTGWSAKAVADGDDGLTRVLWDKTDGTMSLWSLNNLTGVFTQHSFGPFAGWTATGISAGP